MNVQALHFAKICKAVLAIFAPLPRLFSICLISLMLFCPIATLWGQDSARKKTKPIIKKQTPIVAKPQKAAPALDTEIIDTTTPKANYKPYYDWTNLSDSLYTAYKLWYPNKWQKDSTFFANETKKFVDSFLYGSYLKQQLYYPRYIDTVYKGSGLTENPLPNDAQTITKPIPFWIFIMVLLVLVGILFLKYSNYKLFNLLFLSFFSAKSCDEALREQDTQINLYNLAATLICTLVYSIFIWFMAVKPGWLFLHSNQLVTFLLIFTALSVFYLLRFLFIMLVAALLEAENAYGVLVQVTVSGNMWLALGLFPLGVLLSTTFSQFSTPMLPFYLAGGLLIYLIIKQIRVIIQVASGFPHSIIYLILYLCALEIAPYLVVFKAIIK